MTKMIHQIENVRKIYIDILGHAHKNLYPVYSLLKVIDDLLVGSNHKHTLAEDKQSQYNNSSHPSL